VQEAHALRDLRRGGQDGRQIRRALPAHQRALGAEPALVDGLLCASKASIGCASAHQQRSQAPSSAML
jgi:hypothetical protein